MHRPTPYRDAHELIGLARRLRDDRQFRVETGAFLESIGWSTTDITDAIDALDRHLDGPEGVEEMVIHDANAIEVVGALGIAKAFTKGALRGSTTRRRSACTEASCRALSSLHRRDTP
jgi:hypothetical protein